MRTERLGVNLAPPTIPDAEPVDVVAHPIPAPPEPAPERVLEESPLPEELEGEEASERSRKLRWFGRFLVAGLILGAALVASVFLYAGEDEAPPTEAAAVAATEHSVLIAITDEQGRAASIALLTGDSTAERSILVMPPAITMQLPGYGDGQLWHTTTIEGPELLELAVVNELGIRLNRTIVMTREEFTASVGPIRVDIPDAFLVEAPGGDLVAVAAGSDVFVPETVSTLLLSRGESTTLEWLQRQRAVWTAYAEEVASNPDGLGTAVPAAGDLPGLFSDAAVGVLPVDRIGAGNSELYVVDRNSAFYEDRIGFLSLGPDRPRVEILNGTGRVGVTRPIAGLLIQNGYRLIKTDNADKADYQETLVVAQGVWSQEAAVKANELLGVGELVVGRSGSDVVDVSIIVGSDLLP